MIASGKSTYAKNAAKSGMICLNDDAIVNMIHSDDYTLYNKDLKILYKTVENCVISTALAMNRPILVDRGLNISVNGRNRWLALARSFDIPCEVVVFKNEGPQVHANRRFKSDARGHEFEYWKRVAEIHNSEWEIPTLEEGFAEIYNISYQEIMEGKVI